jgi:hypothetical protein
MFDHFCSKRRRASSHPFDCYSSKDLTGDKQDVARVAKQLLNRSASNRVISKPECMVLLGKMNLVTCSETIRGVSVSHSYKITATGTKQGKKVRLNYSNRGVEFENDTLYDFWHRTENAGKTKPYFTVPHFVGIAGQPKYPATETYARAVLEIHKPWRNEKVGNAPERNWISEFEDFVRDERCPASVSIAYNRVKLRHIAKMDHYEPLSKEIDHADEDIDENDRIIMDLAGLASIRGGFVDTSAGHAEKCDLGKDYDWTTTHVLVR